MSISKKHTKGAEEVKTESLKDMLRKNGYVLVGPPESGKTSLVSRLLPDVLTGNSIERWWNKVSSEHKVYPSYAIFLGLPSDKELIRYLTEFQKELDLISGDNCLVIAIANANFYSAVLVNQDWNEAINKYISSDSSVKLAGFLDIEFNDLPCIVLFQSFRSSNYIVLTLKDMSAEEISQEMRTIFSIVQKSISANKNPIRSLEISQKRESRKSKGKAISGKIHRLVGKTFDKAIDAWVKGLIKSSS